jgi:hypothetical protein
MVTLITECCNGVTIVVLISRMHILDGVSQSDTFSRIEK